MDNNTLNFPYGESKSTASVYLLEMWRQSGHSIFSGQVPCQIIIRLIDTEAFSRKIRNNFNFQHYYLNILCAHIDREHFPSRFLTHANGHFLVAYKTLFVTGLMPVNQIHRVLSSVQWLPSTRAQIQGPYTIYRCRN